MSRKQFALTLSVIALASFAGGLTMRPAVARAASDFGRERPSDGILSDRRRRRPPPHGGRTPGDRDRMDHRS